MCHEKRGLRGTEKGAKGMKSLQMKKIGERESKVSASAELPRVRAFLVRRRATVNVWKAESSDWLILQLLKTFNTGWGKGQQIWQLPPEMQKLVRIEPDLPSAVIQILYEKFLRFGKGKKNWVSLESEVQEYHEEICSIAGSVKNKQYWKAHERVCVCMILVWFLQEKRGQKFIQSLASIWTFQRWAELNL